MIAVHVLQNVYDGSSAVVYKLVDFFGSAPAAPVFMFLLGCNALASRHNEPRQLFVRGLKLFLASYVFNAVCHALPSYLSTILPPLLSPLTIQTSQTLQTPQTSQTLSWLFAVDILTFAGLAFMVLGVVRKLKISPAAFLGIAVALHALGTFLNTVCSLHPNFLHPLLLLFLHPLHPLHFLLLHFFLNLFYNASVPGYFSLFTWLIYPAAGFFFADILRRATDEERVWRRAGIVATIVFAAMLAAFCMLPSIHEPYYADEHVYYRNGYFLLIHNLAFVLAWLALWHFACRRFTRLGTGLFLIWSRNLTKIYVMQWFFIGAFFIAPFGDTLKLGTCAYLASVAGILCLCTLIVRHLSNINEIH